MNLNILYINHSDKNAKNWLHIKHSHPFSEIFYITHGKGEFLIADEIVTVKKNDLLYIENGIEHAELSDYANPMEYLVIGLSGVSVNSDGGVDMPYWLYSDEIREMQFYFYKGHEEFSSQKKHSTLVIHQLVQILLILMSRHQEIAVNTTEEYHAQQESLLIKYYLDMNFKESITLEDLAHHFHLSKYHISHIFKRDFGVSPIRYLNLVKLKHIKFLLTSANYTVMEIAISIGFKSQSYLAQFFQKETGMSPMEYRKKHRKDREW